MIMKKKKEVKFWNDSIHEIAKLRCRFSYDTDGYTNAVKWLKEQGKWEYVSTHGQSVDGWSIVETANVLWSQQNGCSFFDKALLKRATIKQIEYVMGVDTYDKDALTYCLGRKVDGMFEIILTKTMRDEKEFKQEVENLIKYFNADAFRSGE
jgi:hypothetical protein